MQKSYCSGACVKRRNHDNGRLAQVPLQLFVFRVLLRLETENGFAFLHQVEPVARNRFQIGRISRQQMYFARLTSEEHSLRSHLRLQTIDFVTALRQLFILRQK